MKIHHLNCATLCPRAPARILGHPCFVCHCLLIESKLGLILVDTGLGVVDLESPRARLGRIFTDFINPRLDREETALRQVERLGFLREDVRHIVMTHLDVDHAGGIADFPDAEIHVFDGEYAAAMARTSKIEQLRYHSVQWNHGPKWQRHALEGESWFGFGSVRAVSGSLPEVLLIPLFGHTRGHCGVAIQSGDGWILHAGDSYFDHAEIDEVSPHCSVGLDVFQRLMQIDGKARLENQQRLRVLKKEQSHQIKIFCAHDPTELEKLKTA